VLLTLAYRAKRIALALLISAAITVITAAAIFALRWFFESKHQPPGQPLQDPAAQSTRQQQQRDPLLRLPRRNSAAERSPRNAFVCRSPDISARKPK
jgi:hypothetical protein